MSFGKTTLKPLDDYMTELPSSPESPFPKISTPLNNIFALETPRWLDQAHFFEGPEFAEEESDLINEEINYQENIFKSYVRTKTTSNETVYSNSSQKQSVFASRTKSVMVNKTDFSFANDVEESYNAKEKFTALHCILLSKLKIGRFAYKRWFSNWKKATIFKNSISEQRYSQYWKLQYVMEKFQCKAVENENKLNQLDKVRIKTAFNRMKLRAEKIKKRELRKHWLVRKIYIKLTKKLEKGCKEAFQKIKTYGRIKDSKLEGIKKIRLFIERHTPLKKLFNSWKDFKKYKDIYGYILNDGVITNGIKKKARLGKVENEKKSIFQSLNIIRTKLQNKRQVSVIDTADLSSLCKIKDDIVLLIFGLNQLIEHQKKGIESPLEKIILALNNSIEALNKSKAKSDLQVGLLKNQISNLRLSNKKSEELILLLKSSSSKLTLNKSDNKHQDYRPTSPTDNTRLFSSLPLPRKRNFLNFHSSHKLPLENPPKTASEPIKIKLKAPYSLSPLYLLFLSFILGCFICYLISK